MVTTLRSAIQSWPPHLLKTSKCRSAVIMKRWNSSASLCAVPQGNQIRNILLLKKHNDEPTNVAAKRLLSHIHSDYPQCNVFIEQDSVQELSAGPTGVPVLDTSSRTGVQVWKRALPKLHSTDESLATATANTSLHPSPEPDLIITLGGDGTILHVSSLYDQPGKVPPVLSFSMGSLGFLTPFSFESHEKTLDHVFQGSYQILERMRLACEIFGQDSKPIKRCRSKAWQVMNEVSIHRGRFPHLSIIDAHFDGQHLTEAVADGLILATPTGSTAYSLSAGGPIAHPSVGTFLLTPIAPRSLSFRTLLLPSSGLVEMKISPRSRAPSELSMDGREVCNLHPGEYVTVKKSRYPVPCVTRKQEGDDWVADINSLLQFNVGFKNSALWRRHTPGD